MYVQGLLPNTNTIVKEVRFTVCPRLELVSSQSAGTVLSFITGETAQFRDINSYFESMFDISLDGVTPMSQSALSSLYPEC